MNDASKTAPRRAAGKRSTYQHGNLPAALKEAVLEMVAERGIKGVAVIEAARRSGVSSGAPYRHFANKESLLAAVGAVVYREIIAAMTEARLGAGPDGADQIAAVARAFVTYASHNRAGIEVLFNAGINHGDHEELAKQDALAYQEYRHCADALGLDGVTGHDLIYATAALAHGFTMLPLYASGSYAISEEFAFEHVEQAVRKLAHGYATDSGL